MESGRDISIDMTTDELSAMTREPDVEGLTLSPAALAALESAAPNPGGVPAHWFTCPLEVARELLAWAEAGEARWRSINRAKAALFHAAARQVRFGSWRVGAGPPP